jgi:RNA polymerase sigma-70 factor (ECF subfamily)
MDDETLVHEDFESYRDHLRAVAYRMLGTAAEAEDAVQEAWLRLSRADARQVENLGGWLTTVVSRVCLDMLRSRASRREEPFGDAGDAVPDAPAGPVARRDPEGEAVLADAIGPALLVVLDALTPPERLAFVLHDMFAVPYDEIGPIVDRSPAAARQLASRARRRVRGAGWADDDPGRRDQVVRAFLAAARDGDFEGLLAVLDPDVVMRADAVAVEVATARRAEGAPPLAPLVRGAPAVARVFAGRARTARPALVDGAPGAVWAPDGPPRSVFDFTIVGGRIVAVELLADPADLAEIDITLLDG